MAAREHFTLRIDLGHDAMRDDDHVADALEKVALRIRTGVEAGTILDENGNTAGRYGFDYHGIDVTLATREENAIDRALAAAHERLDKAIADGSPVGVREWAEAIAALEHANGSLQINIGSLEQ